MWRRGGEEGYRGGWIDRQPDDRERERETDRPRNLIERKYHRPRYLTMKKHLGYARSRRRLPLLSHASRERARGRGRGGGHFLQTVEKVGTLSRDNSRIIARSKSGAEIVRRCLLARRQRRSPKAAPNSRDDDEEETKADIEFIEETVGVRRRLRAYVFRHCALCTHRQPRFYYV